MFGHVMAARLHVLRMKMNQLTNQHGRILANHAPTISAVRSSARLKPHFIGAVRVACHTFQPRSAAQVVNVGLLVRLGKPPRRLAARAVCSVDPTTQSVTPNHSCKELILQMGCLCNYVSRYPFKFSNTVT
jgi:hypothetical protein